MLGINLVKILELGSNPCTMSSDRMDRLKLLKRLDEDETYKREFIKNAQTVLKTVLRRLRENPELCEYLDAHSWECMVDYAKFFTLKVVSYDTDSRCLCPETPEVDKIWHAHILSNLKGYVADCTYVLVAFDAGYWLLQPKSLFINHRVIDNLHENKLMKDACKIIHSLVWPRPNLKRKAAGDISDLSRATDGSSNGYEEEEEGQKEPDASEGVVCG